MHSLVEEALGELGGIDSFVRPGQSVLLKPDQCCPRSAEDGVTTDPFLVGALIRLCYQAGARNVRVGASSYGFLDSMACMRATGMASVALAEGAELVDLGSETCPQTDVELPEGRVLQRAAVPLVLLDSDVKIAVSKGKTDYLDSISGSLEFCTGGVNQRWRARQNLAADVIDRYADIMTVIRPDLCITDAVICGEGDGPHANTPHWCGAVLASADPVATDVAVAMLLGHDYRRLCFAQAQIARGLGYAEPIVFPSTGPERIAFQAWRAHEDFGHLPVNVLIGEGVSRAGTIAHVKAALESCQRTGVLQRGIGKLGAPTFMLGAIDDPEFERHVAEGPYIVCDDSAHSRYREDPRVSFMPGHPVLDSAVTHLARIFGGRQAAGHGTSPLLAAASACAAAGFILSRRR